MKIICPCGNEKKVFPSRINRTKYCSLLCKRKYAKRPSGLKYNVIKDNKRWFKKSHIPWIAGKTHTKEVIEKVRLFNTGKHYSPRTEFKKGEFSDDNHPKWKGDSVGYHALHAWVVRKLGKAKVCKKCKSIINVQWANKSHNYERNLKDWIALCIKCHNKYDMGTWGSINKKYGKK